MYCTVLYCTVLIQAVPFNTKYTAIMETIYDASEHAKKVSPYTSIVGAQNEHNTSLQKAATKAFLWSNKLRGKLLKLFANLAKLETT